VKASPGRCSTEPGRRSAALVEAYPHRLKKDNYMGHLDLFLERGFAVVRKTATRAVVRRSLHG
jgi:hypothetical protein